MDTPASTARGPRADPTLDSNNIETPATSRKSTPRAPLSATRPPQVPKLDMELVKQKLAERLAVRGGRSSGAGMGRAGPYKPPDTANFAPSYAPVRRAGRSGGVVKG